MKLLMNNENGVINYKNMNKIIFTPKAPAPIGPYSQAVKAGNTLYISGQIPLDATTNKLILDSIENQTKMVMENIKYILESENMNFTDVVKATIFITNMDNFQKINEVYSNYFPENYAPARETVQVSRLPKDVDVEISVIAIK